jgi:hypothetical protein
MSGFASNDDSSSPSNKRTRFFNNEVATVPQVAGTAKKQLVTKSPTEAAMAMKNSHIATLHEALQPFLHDLTETCLRRYAAYYYKNAKHEEMHLDPNYVPASCKKIGLTLQGIDEVKETEDFKSLCSHLAVRLEEIQRKLVKDFAMRVDDMNRRALWHRFLASFCELLPKAAKVFIAQHGISGYNEHQAVVDLIATLPDEVLSATKMTTREFLIFYRKTNSLAVLPTPTVQHNLANVLNEINGPTPSVETAPPPQATATTPSTATTQATAATPTTTAATAAGRRTTTITPNGFIFGGTVTEATGTNVYPPHPRNKYLRTSPTPTSATTNAIKFSTALVMFNEEAQVGNRAIGNLQAGVTEEAPDEEMDNEFATQDEDMALAANIIGGRSTIRTLLLFLIQQAIANPITEFHRVHKVNEESKRIAAAIIPRQLSDAAQRIAAVVQAERPADRPVLCGLIREHANKSIEEMRKRLQSLEAKAANDSGKNSGRPPTQKKGSGNGNKKTTTKSTPKTNPNRS